VFPCKATADKRAYSKASHLPGERAPGKHDGGHWLASRDEAQIRDWWRRWPDGLIGFPTGLHTRCVVDLDSKEYPAQAMLAALNDWCGRFSFVDQVTGGVLEPAISRT
jgi:putative DNA primase/helicase